MGWPYKIEQQMEQTVAQLEEDEERFRKLQLQDQANFNDRLDTLFVSMMSLLSLTVTHLFMQNNDASRVK